MRFGKTSRDTEEFGGSMVDKILLPFFYHEYPNRTPNSPSSPNPTPIPTPTPTPINPINLCKKILLTIPTTPLGILRSNRSDRGSERIGRKILGGKDRIGSDFQNWRSDIRSKWYKFIELIYIYIAIY